MKNYTDELFAKHATDIVDTEIINKLIEIAVRLPGNPTEGRTGGFLAIQVKDYLIVQPFGAYPKGKRNRYFFNATEKVIRMVKNEETRSFQSRNEEKEQWGGGLLYEGRYVAFSGFPEKIDETISFVYAYYLACKEISDFYSKGTDWLDHVLSNDFRDNEFIRPVWEVFAKWLEERV